MRNMPENLTAHPERGTPTLTSWMQGGTFSQRRDDIFKRVQESAEKCQHYYAERKELASEKHDIVGELLEALEDAFNYGLRQNHATVTVTAVSLFQNMQEIVTGQSSNGSSTETTFWDYCQMQLTQHERQRYEQLKHVWTKSGRGRAFIRATLNEHSLQRYLLTWLSVESELARFYTPWSLLLHLEYGKQLTQIIGNLKHILFALTVDTTELNAMTRSLVAPPVREEPIIYAPKPQPTTANKNKRRNNAIERPITSSNSTEDLLGALQTVHVTPAEQVESEEDVQVTEELATDPIEPELEFLKQPLPDFLESTANISPNNNSVSTCTSAEPEYSVEYDEEETEDKSDTSSQYSKSSSAPGYSANQHALEEKLREMTERCALLETRVAQLSRENRQMVRRLTQHFHETGIDPSSSLTSNFLITIPHVRLLKSKRPTSTAYHVYEIHITMRQHLEHWVLTRRYQEFFKLHKSLQRTHPTVASSVEFPPKKHFGNMNAVFVEERRQQLQIYLLNLVESLPQVEACKSKAELQKAFPFLRER